MQQEISDLIFINHMKEKQMTDQEILVANESLRQPVECWTRVMGYFRPISEYNRGKQAEFKERLWFRENSIKSEKANFMDVSVN